MAVTSLPPSSKEIQMYLRPCEDLCSAAVTNKTPPFSQTEMGILNESLCKRGDNHAEPSDEALADGLHPWA